MHNTTPERGPSDLRTSECRPSPNARHPSGNVLPLIARGPRGLTRVLLRLVECDLYIEREDIPKRGTRTVQTMLFSSRPEFEAWCEADPLRFETPLLLANLKREAAALWNPGHASATFRMAG